VGNINRRVVVQASPGMKQDPISKITNPKGAGGVTHMVEHLPSKYEALSSILALLKRKKKSFRKKQQKIFGTRTGQRVFRLNFKYMIHERENNAFYQHYYFSVIYPIMRVYYRLEAHIYKSFDKAFLFRVCKELSKVNIFANPIRKG
jgi:hypothetical protein